MNGRLYSMAILAVVLVIVGLSHTPISIRAMETVTCAIDFEARVHTGASAGMSLKGDLVLNVEPDGSASGTLMQATGGDIKAVGQINGLAINLAFELSQGDYIYGVGTLTDRINTCTGYIGGVLAGAKAGELGDWGYAIGGRSSPSK